MRGKFVSILIAVHLLFSGMTAFAQVGEGASPKVKEKLIAAENALKKIESLVDKIEIGKTLTEVESQELNSLMLMHAEALRDGFAETMKEVETEVQSSKTPIKLGSLKSLEKTAKDHEARAQNVHDKSFKIQLKVMEGKIKPDKEILRKMKPEEKQQFRKLLTPGARKDLEKEYPDVFPAETSSIISDFYAAARPRLNAVGYAVRPALEAVGDFLVEPAYAFTAAAVVSACAAALGISVITAGAATWPAILGCVGAAGIGGWRIYDEYVSFQNCLASKPTWDTWGRAYCWFRFVSMVG